MKLIAIVLIVLGLAGLLWGGINWTTKDKVVDVGPIEVTKTEHKSIPVSPIVGGLLLVAGVGLFFAGGRRT